MTAIRTVLRAAVLVGAFGLSAAPAQALSSRTWVSGLGNDANSCATPALACRTFQRAHNETSPGGEVNALDAASYGTIAITKAISIVNDGAGSALVQRTTNGGPAAITINVGASDAVHLRGLTIEGMGNVGHGIDLQTGGSLDIVNCVIRRVSNGVQMYQTAATGWKFSVVNTIITDSARAIDVQPFGSGGARGTIEGLTASKNSFGLHVGGGGSAASAKIVISVARSIFADNAGGVHVFSPPGAAIPRVTVSDSTISGAHEGSGVSVGSLGEISLARSNIVGNLTGAFIPGGGSGVIFTMGNNNFKLNTSDGAALTPFSPK